MCTVPRTPARASLPYGDFPGLGVVYGPPSPLVDLGQLSSGFGAGRRLLPPVLERAAPRWETESRLPRGKVDVPCHCPSACHDVFEDLVTVPSSCAVGVPRHCAVREAGALPGRPRWWLDLFDTWFWGWSSFQRKPFRWY